MNRPASADGVFLRTLIRGESWPVCPTEGAKLVEEGESGCFGSKQVASLMIIPRQNTDSIAEEGWQARQDRPRPLQ
jgi:hypothetical protein